MITVLEVDEITILGFSWGGPSAVHLDAGHPKHVHIHAVARMGGGQVTTGVS